MAYITYIFLLAHIILLLRAYHIIESREGKEVYLSLLLWFQIAHLLISSISYSQ